MHTIRPKQIAMTAASRMHGGNDLELKMFLDDHTEIRVKLSEVVQPAPQVVTVSEHCAVGPMDMPRVMVTDETVKVFFDVVWAAATFNPGITEENFARMLRTLYGRERLLRVMDAVFDHNLHK